MKGLLGLLFIMYVAYAAIYVRNGQPHLTESELFLCMPEWILTLKCKKFERNNNQNPNQGE